jgi:small subunit ribosomal protein S18
MERFAYRPFQPGDIYSPHDLSPAEQKKWKRTQAPATDVFDALNLNPLDQYKVRLPAYNKFEAGGYRLILTSQNFSMMTEYMTHMGRIKHRNVTGLRAVNQRKLGKAIRRAVGLGLMPSVHGHPEILAQTVRYKLERGFYGKE